MVWQCYSLLHIAVTISHFMDNRSLQLSLQVGIQIYLYLFILFYSLSFIISAANIPYFSYFLRQSILPFTIGSDMEPLLPEWYWVRHHSISLFSRTDIYSSAVRKCTTVIFLFLSSHQFEIYFHQPDKPPMYIRRRCCLYRTLSIRNTGTHGI